MSSRNSSELCSIASIRSNKNVSESQDEKTCGRPWPVTNVWIHKIRIKGLSKVHIRTSLLRTFSLHVLHVDVTYVLVTNVPGYTYVYIRSRHVWCVLVTHAHITYVHVPYVRPRYVRPHYVRKSLRIYVHITYHSSPQLPPAVCKNCKNASPGGSENATDHTTIPTRKKWRTKTRTRTKKNQEQNKGRKKKQVKKNGIWDRKK